MTFSFSKKLCFLGALALLVGSFLGGCQSQGSAQLTDEAFQKGIISRPAFDVKYEILWKAAITAVQELGYAPVDSYQPNLYIKTDTKIEDQDISKDIKIATAIHIYFEKLEKPIKAEYALRICVPRFKSPLGENNWQYVETDMEAQKRFKEQFQSVLERMYREGFDK